MEIKFNCDCCGLCCLKITKILPVLDRGDGICKYLDIDEHLCTIYDTRPTICNIDKFYDKHLSNKMSREEWHNINYEACDKLKEEAYG